MTGRRLIGHGGHRRDASGHLRTVSALLDLDEFEVVDLQQDRRSKQNVIGVIPKGAAGRTIFISTLVW